MQTLSDAIVRSWQVRKTKAQKLAFIGLLKEGLGEAGYEARVEEGGTLVKSRNVVVGDPDSARLIFSAHYDTCAAMPFPNFVTPRNIPLYLLYQLALTAAIVGLSLGVGILAGVIAGNDTIGLFIYFAALLALCAQITFGWANRHTANDNTSGVVTLIEIALALPKPLRGSVAFVFFDNEELGMVGARHFALRHRKAAEGTPLVNFDCVSDGEHVLLVRSKRALKDARFDACLRAAFPRLGAMTPHFERNGSAFYPSDQLCFRKGVGVAALNKGLLSILYVSRIHTGRDVIFNEPNIAYLTAASLGLAERYVGGRYTDGPGAG